MSELKNEVISLIRNKTQNTKELVDAFEVWLGSPDYNEEDFKVLLGYLLEYSEKEDFILECYAYDTPEVGSSTVGVFGLNVGHALQDFCDEPSIRRKMHQRGMEGLRQGLEGACYLEAHLRFKNHAQPLFTGTSLPVFEFLESYVKTIYERELISNYVISDFYARNLMAEILSTQGTEEWHNYWDNFILSSLFRGASFLSDENFKQVLMEKIIQKIDPLEFTEEVCKENERIDNLKPGEPIHVNTNRVYTPPAPRPVPVPIVYTVEEHIDRELEDL